MVSSGLRPASATDLPSAVLSNCSIIADPISTYHNLSRPPRVRHWDCRGPVLALSEPNVKSPAHVDLLHLVNPRLDRVQGIWFFEKNGRLRSPCEFEARLEIPVVPPKSYALRMTLERLQGRETFGIGVVAGGRQTMISIDNSNSRFTGLHNLDGKPAGANESTKRGTFLPLHQVAQLECRVTDRAIRLIIDKQEVLNWQGDPARLSVSPDWPVPHSDWLFISAFSSEFEISSFALEVVK